MPKLAANISMMFNEVDFLDRFDAAAMAGFKGVEFLFPYDCDAVELRTSVYVGEEFMLSKMLFQNYSEVFPKARF